MSHHQLLPLECLHANEWAEVTDVAGDGRWVSRMAELGIRPGARLHMLRPGSPCLFMLGACRLSLRGDEALKVLVRPLGKSSEVALCPS